MTVKTKAKVTKRLVATVSLYALMVVNASSQSLDDQACVRSTESANAYLEFRQCESWRELGITPTIFGGNNVEEALALKVWLAKKYGASTCQDSFEARELYEAGVRFSSWTKYDSPELLLILADREQRIRSVISDSTAPLPREFVLGSLPLGELTALVSKVPQSQVQERVIMFDAGLMSLLWQLSKVVGQVLYVTSDGSFNRSIGNIEDAKQYAADLLTRIQEESNFGYMFGQQLYDYVVFQDPMRRYICYNIEESAYDLGRKLNLSMELFVMAHEITHITAMHHERKGRDYGDLNGTQISQAQEFESDIGGISRAMLALADAGIDAYFAIGGATVFFYEQELSCRAWHVLAGGSEDSYQGYPNDLMHPPPLVRLAKIRDRVNASGTPDADRILAFSASLGVLMEVLWVDAQLEFANSPLGDSIQPAKRSDLQRACSQI